jgi:hypothetical protein
MTGSGSVSFYKQNKRFQRIKPYVARCAIAVAFYQFFICQIGTCGNERVKFGLESFGKISLNNTGFDSEPLILRVAQSHVVLGISSSNFAMPIRQKRQEISLSRCFSIVEHMLSCPAVASTREPMVSKPSDDNSKQGENGAKKYFAHGLVFMFGILIGAAIYAHGRRAERASQSSKPMTSSKSQT